MGLTAEFDDRKTHLEAVTEEYHPYEYQTEGNGSWAGALPVKQYVPGPSGPIRSPRGQQLTAAAGGCTTRASRRMPAAWASLGEENPPPGRRGTDGGTPG